MLDTVLIPLWLNHGSRTCTPRTYEQTNMYSVVRSNSVEANHLQLNSFEATV